MSSLRVGELELYINHHNVEGESGEGTYLQKDFDFYCAGQSEQHSVSL